MVLSAHNPSVPVYVADCRTVDVDGETAAANARLIAAAPDLFAFIQELRAEYAAYLADDSQQYPDRLLSHCSLAEEIVAKATGR